MEVAAPGSCLEQQGPIFQASTSPQSQKPPPDDACIYGKSVIMFVAEGARDTEEQLILQLQVDIMKIWGAKRRTIKPSLVHLEICVLLMLVFMYTSVHKN